MGGIEFDSVSFRYSRQKPILDGFTLTVDAGETVMDCVIAPVDPTSRLGAEATLPVPGWPDPGEGDGRPSGMPSPEIVAASRLKQLAAA